ncbi:tetratricopeptide repeat protein [Nocardia alni]|uniref:tetratricopeptide repeat protein n=1 Tax=Nocardia alni TaxID=2815723 RepID=UPI001C225438|nr:tetratricopeptide repeat protein [Nocardia alni]
MAIYEDIGIETGRAEALGHLGWMRHLQGRQDAAMDLLREALTIFQNIHSSPGETETYNRIAAVTAEIGDWEQALSIFERALGSARRIRNRIEEARALEGIARCCARFDHGPAAETLLRQAMDIYSELGAAEARTMPRELRAQPQLS